MRKTLIYTVSLILFISMMGCNKATNVLLVVGGHSYDTTEYFDIFRNLEGIRFDSISYPAAREFLQSDQVMDYDVIVYYDFIPDMAMKDSSIFLHLSQTGKSMLFLHHALGTFQKWEGYKKMVGGRYMMPEFTTDSTLLSDYKHDIDMVVEVVDHDHPVTHGISEFTIHDEGYSNLSIVEGVIPLLRTDHPDCSSLVAWVHEYNASTTAYLIFGHDKLAYENKSFQQLLFNAINWLADQD